MGRRIIIRGGDVPSNFPQMPSVPQRKAVAEWLLVDKTTKAVVMVCPSHENALRSKTSGEYVVKRITTEGDRQAENKRKRERLHRGDFTAHEIGGKTTISFK